MSKIVVVDDDVAFCGGMNTSEDYAGARRGNGRFRDTHAQLEGPSVYDLAAVLRTSLVATGKRPILPTAPAALHAGDVASGLVTLLQSDSCGSTNICSGAPTAIGDLVGLLGQLLNQDPCPVLALPAQRAAGVPVLFGENEKLTGLGWRQQVTLQRGLEQMLRDLSAREQQIGDVVHGM